MFRFLDHSASFTKAFLFGGPPARSEPAPRMGHPFVGVTADSDSDSEEETKRGGEEEHSFPQPLAVRVRHYAFGDG